MNYLNNQIIKMKDENKVFKKSQLFAPAGQSTQMIIGASGETDQQIIQTAQYFYKNFNLKRVYYSGYIPISNDARLPGIGSSVPLVRENRLYQTDWLMRFYGFAAQELLNNQNPLLDLDIDPKLSWALRNWSVFPIDINKADLQLIIRIPGIGIGSANKIVSARRFGLLNMDQLKKIGVAINRAKYFIQCKGFHQIYSDKSEQVIKQYIVSASQSKYNENTSQLRLF